MHGMARAIGATSLASLVSPAAPLLGIRHLLFISQIGASHAELSSLSHKRRRCFLIGSIRLPHGLSRYCHTLIRILVMRPELLSPLSTTGCVTTISKIRGECQYYIYALVLHFSTRRPSSPRHLRRRYSQYEYNSLQYQLLFSTSPA